MLIEQIDDLQNPFYEDLKFKVMLSRPRQPIPFTFLLPASNDPLESRVQEYHVEIEPRREEYDSAPVIGVLPAFELKLPPARDVKRAGIPLSSGPAAAARELDLQPDDVVFRTTDPDHPSEMTKLPTLAGGKGTDYRALAERFERLTGKPMKLEIQRGGKLFDRQVEAIGFQPFRLIVPTHGHGASPVV